MRFPTTLLLLTITTLALTNPVPDPKDDNFQLLAREADEAALHAALHAKKEYKHGIFPHDRHALEAVRREHAEEALQIVKFALLRRDNSTTTTTHVDTTSTTIHTTDLTTARSTTTISTKTETSTTTTTTASPTNAGTTTPSPTVTETSFTTTRTTVVTNDEGQPSTITQTDIVIITPTQQIVYTSKTTTAAPGLQTRGAAGKVELGWVKVGVAVMAGVGGLVL